MESTIRNIQSGNNLFSDIKQLIADARVRVAAMASAGIATLYWHIGERINREILGNQRVEYGKQIVSPLATQLSWSHFEEDYSKQKTIELHN